jgi:hypothetical protein
MVLEDSIWIGTGPHEVYEWFLGIEDNYRAWHPDHVALVWREGRPFEPGSVAYAEEYLHDCLIRMRMRSTGAEPDRLLRYRLLFPLSLICPRGSFRFEPEGEGCLFTAALTIRFGWLLEMVAGRHAGSLRAHIREEAENLKRILEGVGGAGQSTGS